VTRALILDFDGVVLDTEKPYYRAWRETFEDFGCELPLATWHSTIGTQNGWDAHAALEQLVGESLDRQALRDKRYARFEQLMSSAAVAEGVPDLLQDANRLGIQVGLASSSSYDWVLGFLRRFELADRFETIRCWDGSVRAKPAPDLYLQALGDLGVEPTGAVAVEDSPNGIRAAKAAGVFCVAVPCEMTKDLDLSEADMLVTSLREVSLADLLGLTDASAD
jgi:HAD superfamily hydrolase (TIGR01509 family)